MTSPLREALHAVANTMPPAAVPHNLFDRGRQRRRRSTTVVAGGIVAVVAALVGVLPGLAIRSEPPGGPGGKDRPGLPTRLHVPPLRTATVGLSKPGAAAAIFGGDATRTDWYEGRFAVVAADDDRYRVINEAEVYTAPGFETLLSPDGRFLARHMQLHSLNGNRAPSVWYGFALAFSPSGTLLVTTDPAGATGPAGSIDEVQVHRLDRDAKPARVATGIDIPPGGWTAAVSPDDAILAVQVHNQIWLVRPRYGSPNEPYRRLPLSGGRLAGPASWLPDGSAIMVAERHGTGWRMVARDASTGQPVPGVSFPELPDSTYVRIVAWHADGTAIALVGVPSSDGSDMQLVENTGQVRVVALRRGAATPVTLFTTPAGISELDVAGDVVATGALRPAGDPSYGPPQPLFLIPGLLLLVTSMVILVKVVHVTRERAVIRRYREQLVT